MNPRDYIAGLLPHMLGWDGLGVAWREWSVGCFADSMAKIRPWRLYGSFSLSSFVE